MKEKLMNGKEIFHSVGLPCGHHMSQVVASIIRIAPIFSPDTSKFRFSQALYYYLLQNRVNDILYV